MRKTLSSALALLCAAVVVTGYPGAAYATGHPLEGETLHSDPNQVTITASCNPEGTSTITFDATGIAAGPYPGTFEARGTATVGPNTPSFTDPLSRGLVITFHETFRIVSGSTVIEGTKKLSGFVSDQYPNRAACFEVDNLDEPPFFDQEGFIYAAQALMEYEATITSDQGTGRDQGQAQVVLGKVRHCYTFEGSPFCSGGNGFDQVFVLSTGTPVTTPGKVTGGGWILTGGDRVSFGFNAEAAAAGATPNGKCNVIDHATQTQIKCLTVESLVVTPTHATFSGQARINGALTDYRIDVDDLGEPGVSDTFKIQTDSGYSAAGILAGGNIQIHR